MRIIYLLVIAVALQACASKTAGQADGKKNQPVVSVFDQAPATSTGPAQTQDQKTPTSTTTPPAVTLETVQSATTEPANKNSPKEVIKSYTAELQAIQVTQDPKQKNRDKQISEKVRGFFDFKGLAQLSLGSNWTKLDPKKQAEYVNLFTQLIEKSYLQRSKSLVGNYKLSYGNEKIAGNKATVECNIYQNDVDLQIVYELHKIADSWMIYNIVFDQVNLVKNYQTQFNQIIAKSNIEGLLNMMKKKLKENSSEIDAAL